MNAGLIGSILESLIRSLPADIVKKSLDGLLDKIEESIATSPNKWDDAIVLPLIAALRKQLSITEEPGSKYADAGGPPNGPAVGTIGEGNAG